MEDVEIEYKGQKFNVGLIQAARYFQQNVKGNHYAPVYDSRAFEYLAFRAKRRVRRKFDNRIVIAGPVRTGKTTIAVTWAKHIDPDFPVRNVAFRLADYRKLLSSLPPADPSKDSFPTAVLDESGVDLYAKDWATVWVKNMAKVFQVVGKKRLTSIMNLPHRNMLAKDMRDQMRFWVNTIDDEEELRGYAEVRESKSNPWASPYWNPLFGLVFDELSDKWWAEYESAKDDFIDDYISEEPAQASQKIEKLREQRDKALRELRKNHTVRQIEDLTGVDHAHVVRLKE